MSIRDYIPSAFELPTPDRVEFVGANRLQFIRTTIFGCRVWVMQRRTYDDAAGPISVEFLGGVMSITHTNFTTTDGTLHPIRDIDDYVFVDLAEVMPDNLRIDYNEVTNTWSGVKGKINFPTFNGNLIVA